MMKKPELPTVTGSSALAVCHWLDQQGLDSTALALAADIEKSLLARQDSRVLLASFNRLLELAAAELGDPGMGLKLGSWTDSSHMGVIGHIVFNNRTLRQALEQYVRLSTLVSEGIVVRFEASEAESVLTFECADPGCYSSLNLERMLAQGVTRARRFVSEKIYLRRAGFAHPAQTRLADYEAVFGCPVAFSQPSCYVTFDSAFLSFEVLQRNPYLHQVLTRHVETLLRKLQSRRKLSLQVRKLLEKQLSQAEVDIVMIAEQLAMSRQTLYRKLKQEGISFQEIVEEVRHEKAMAYLSEGRYSLSEIAFLLGFSEQSAFSRAFKRWTGESPAHYRQK